jgi:FlaA1/EpsC-like NDP-sugar epimerase
MNSFFENKRVLVTGACGTVGSELIRQLLEDYHVEELIAIDNNESELFFLEHKFASYAGASFVLADIRDRRKLTRLMNGINVVFHAAAFKHVIMCERSPFEAVQTNIMGVKNIIIAGTDNNVDRIIFTSSDKAVNPTNVMGTSKLMGERLITAGNSNMRNINSILASTRFGNVLGSRGSVIPIFSEQIKNGGPITLTDHKMTRFIMSIKGAVQLVIDSAAIAKGGEVFITKMPVIRIVDLAKVMINELAPLSGYDPEDIKIEIIGAKPGEKMYEELMSQDETSRAFELEKYFIVRPAFASLYRKTTYDYPNIKSSKVTNPYNSSNEIPLTIEQLRTFLIENNLVEEVSSPSHPAERYWPDGNFII